MAERAVARARRSLGLRHPVEVAVATTGDLPLGEALHRLRLLTKNHGPPVPGATRFLLTAVLQHQPGSIGIVELRRRAAWSWAASSALQKRLLGGRAAEVTALLEPVDTKPVDTLRAGGRGVIIAGVHLGVPFAARFAIAGALPGLRAFVSDRTDWFPGEEMGTRDARERRASLASAAATLRGGGIVYAAVDGRQTSALTSVVVCGRPIDLGRGVAALARVSRASALPAVALWTPDGRIVVRFGPPLPGAPFPESGAKDAEDRWERRWLEEWARWYETIVISEPDNIRFDGGLWRRRGLLQ